jgi:3-hydroxyacyl-[acyl-carrier-protein] dehydratase
MKEINLNEIKELLPHRYPFLFVDRVLNYEPGKSILAVKCVTANEEYFNGHFPQTAVMPGVLQLEALAQTAGLLYFLTTNSKPSPENWFYFAGVDNARFKRVVMPGDQLKLQVELLKHKRGVYVFDCKATVDNNIVCETQLMIAKGAIK